MPKHRVPRTEDTVLPGNLWRKMRPHLEHVLRGTSATHGFAGDYLQQEVFSKYLDPQITAPEVRRSEAINKWLRTEHKNECVNRHLMLFEGDLGWISYEGENGLRAKIRRMVKLILGPLPLSAYLPLAVTNGASTRVPRSSVAAAKKLTGAVHITKSALPVWVDATRSTVLQDLDVEVVRGSELFTVPKKTDIDRVACKEPEGNMLLQRGVGLWIRERLKRFGVDLNDQRVNQRLAQTAVRDGLATIDLSSASDSVSRQIVMELLPADWWALLDDLRVVETNIDGDWHKLAMFSSMGNGFTFELESLLFFAITSVVCRVSGFRGSVSVYGDDIIAPAKAVRRLRQVFHLFGFTMNPKKTHATGRFRESCGRHYYSTVKGGIGCDVTPFYIRKELTTLPELINLLNHLLEWDGRGWGFFMNEEPYRFWKKYRGYVPSYLWGGIDPADNTALVTGDRPRKRLVPKTKLIDQPHDGAFRLWCVRREVSDREVGIDPRVEIGMVSRRLVSLGEVTTWVPDLLAPMWERDTAERSRTG